MNQEKEAEQEGRHQSKAGEEENAKEPESVRYDGRFSKMLVAIDGSENADYALNVAIHLGEEFSSTVDLVYVHGPAVPIAVPTPVYDPLSGGPILPSQAPLTTTQEGRRSTLSKNEALLEQRKKCVEARGLECNVKSIESEDVAGEIIRLASAGGYGLIVLGSRGLSGLQSLILGSISKKVAKESKTSVLVVKSRVEGLPKILVAYDGSEEAKEALLAAAEIGKGANGQVSVIGVVSIPVSPEGIVIPENVSKWEVEMTEFVREGIELLKTHGIEKCEGKTIDAQDVARGIVEEASRGGYDLIVVGNRGYGRLRSFFLGSVASGVADSAKTNILIVRKQS